MMMTSLTGRVPRTQRLKTEDRKKKEDNEKDGLRMSYTTEKTALYEGGLFC